MREKCALLFLDPFFVPGPWPVCVRFVRVYVCMGYRRKMMEVCGEAENRLASELMHHELQVEKDCLDPLNQLAEVTSSAPPSTPPSTPITRVMFFVSYFIVYHIIYFDQSCGEAGICK